MMQIPGIIEYATIDAVPLCAGASIAHAAWHPRGPEGLYDLKRQLDKRGTDDLIPGVDEHIRNPRRPTLSRRLVPMFFGGTHDPDGVAFDDHREGVDSNLLLFQELVAEQNDEVDLVLTLRDRTLYGAVVVEDFTYGDILDSGGVFAVLDVSIGRKLTESGS